MNGERSPALVPFLSPMASLTSERKKKKKLKQCKHQIQVDKALASDETTRQLTQHAFLPQPLKAPGDHTAPLGMTSRQFVQL